MPTLDQHKLTLQAFLSAPERVERCFNLDQLQGTMAALLSDPEPGAADGIELACLALADDTEDIDQWLAMGELRYAWVALLNQIDEALAMASFDLAEHYPLTDERSIPQNLSDWCDGYLRGYMRTEDAWQGVYAELKDMTGDAGQELEENHQATLNLIGFLTNVEEGMATVLHPERALASLEQFPRIVGEGVIAIHRLALELEEAALDGDFQQPVVREAPKIGRNDPCPCGSGKKYKKCCMP